MSPLLLLVPALAIATGLAPDFSGRWTTDPLPAAADQTAGRGGAAQGGRGAQPADLGSGWGSTISITQDSARLTVEYAFFARGDMQPPLRFVYALDGSETKNAVLMGRGVQTQSSRASWQADTLVITTLHAFTDPQTGRPATAEVKQELTLESPTSLLVVTTRAGILGGPPSTSRTVYRKLT